MTEIKVASLPTDLKSLGYRLAGQSSSLTKQINAINATGIENVPIADLIAYKKALEIIQENHQLIIDAILRCENADEEQLRTKQNDFEDKLINIVASIDRELRVKDANAEASKKFEKIFQELDYLEDEVKDINGFIENHQHDPMNATMLKNLLKEIEIILQKYKETMSVAKALISEEDEDTVKSRFLSFKVNCMRNIVWLQDAIRDSEPSTIAVALETKRTQRSAPKIKLPPLDIGSFDGSLDKWISFRDSFKSLIHDNSDLTGSIKFRYLKNAITHSLSPIRDLPETDEGYNDAWTLVNDRYHNEREIVDSHFSAIMKLKKMSDDSHEDLQKLTNDVKVHTAALERICGKEKLFDALIAHISMFRLDKTTREKVEEEVQDKIPIWPEVCKILEKRAKLLSVMPKAKPIQSKPVTAPTQTYSKPWVTNSLAATTQEAAATNSLNTSKAPQAANAKLGGKFQLSLCRFCTGSHKIYACPEFNQMAAVQRLKAVKDKKLCENCLGDNCQQQCLSLSTCKVCNQRHNTMLHDSQQRPQVSRAGNQQQVSSGSQNISQEVSRPSFNVSAPLFRASANCNTVMNARRTFLSTAIVKVYDTNGELHELRALLDGGAEANFITKSAANALKLNQERTFVETVGFGQQSTIIDRMTSLRVRLDGDECLELNCLITKKVSGNIPAFFTSKESFGIPPKFGLADPKFNVPGKIDLLIGNEHYWDLMKQQIVKLDSGINLIETRLGWMIAGSINDSPQVVRQCNFNKLVDLDETLQRFYKLEDYRSEKRFLTDEERHCEEVFEQTHQRAADGRFIITIPMKENLSQLADNRNQAYSQFVSNEKRLQKNEWLKNEYDKFMQEYIKLGHMEEVTDHQDQQHGFFLPHHAVEKPDSTSTKVRVVFNGSAKTKSGLSLNDVQCIGPKIQSDSYELTLKFRQHVIMIKSDIAKMYRQVEINPDQRNYQKIFHRPSPSEKLKVYRLKTVTYGTSSASFQSQRCLKQLAIDHAIEFPEASKEIEQGFYVDDLITGATSVPEAIKLYNEIDKIISSAQMKLRKLSSSSEEFLKFYPKEDLEFPDNRDQLIGVLGMKYNPATDVIHFNMKDITLPKIISKRHILSEIASITDPDGLLGPVVFEFKKFMKSVHMCKQSWDAPVEQREAEKWAELATAIPEINKVTVPRLITLSTYITLQLHGFSDASEEGYGAVFYARSEDANGLVAVRLITAKSRVSPAEKRSIPRLELCGAIVMTDLRETLKTVLTINFQKTFFWMDSAIAIHWINKSPTQLQPFVANRVSHIKEFTKDVKWQHVRGEENPADLISRGLMPSELVNNSFWFNGPEFLKKHEELWPTSIVTIDPENPLYKSEFKKIFAFPAYQQIDNLIRIVEDASTLDKARKKIAIISRFPFNMRASISKTSKRIGLIMPSELVNAELIIAGMYQQKHFPDDRKALKEGKEIPKNSKIKNLAPFWDPKHDFIRVGGRLGHAQHCPIDMKHQILIPKGHLATLIVRKAHTGNMHCGQQATLAHIRQQYWPIRVKNTIQKELHQCITCFRVRPKLVEQFMGQLPAPRVTPSPPFYNTGVDYAGAFNVKVSSIRNAKSVKCYTAVFVCLATKAIHIEIVSDLTTKAFIAALDRFFSRRGFSANVYSDNGTQFHGANNDLKQIHAFLQSPQVQHQIVTSLRDNEVTWHFNAPRAPEHGGLWEAAVKSMKHHMHRVIKDSLLTLEEFATLTCKIEAILNSRPLTAISNDPNDLQALTAGHFLIGRPLKSLPQHDHQDVPLQRLQRWDRIQQMQQHFWKRWSNEYLHQLQIRTKRYRERTEINENQLVLIHVDNQPAMQWPIARIVAIHPGQDGTTRVATVKTSHGVYQRPINKLALMPMDLETSLLAAGC